MKKLGLIALFGLLVISCKEQTSSSPEISDTIVEVSDYDLEVVDFNGLEPYLSKNDDKTYVVNFWATWCGPCIKELPYFEELNQNFNTKNVEVILVSLDFPKQYEKKLIPFIQDKKLQSRVIALNDTKMNDWIPKVDENWSGAIPATVIYNANTSKFYERSFTYKELEEELQTFLIP